MGAGHHRAEDFRRVVGEGRRNGGAVFFELCKEVLVAEMHAVESADGEGNRFGRGRGCYRGSCG